MSAPLLSVIVPVYKAGPFLRPCIRSLLRNQGNPEFFEVIAVDDASPDDSATILEEFADTHRNFRFIRFPENRGVGAARNAGIETATGEWLAFCDADDAYVPGAIHRLVRELANTECELAVFGMNQVDRQGCTLSVPSEPNGRILDMSDPAIAVPFVREAFPHRLWAWNKCFRRSLVGLLRFPDFQPCEDAIYSLNCILKAKRILSIPDILYEYVQHEGSCLKTVSPKRVRGDILGMEGLFQTIKPWPYFPLVQPTVRNALEDVFLRPTVMQLQRAVFHDAVAWNELKNALFETALHVFGDPALCGRAQRTFFRLALSSKSLGLLSAALRAKDLGRRSIRRSRRRHSPSMTS